jgi:VWFA-related protein
MKNSIFFLILISVFTFLTFGQERCFTAEETKKVIESVKSKAIQQENKALRKELVKMREERQKFNAKIYENLEKNRALIREGNLMGEKHLLRLCQIIKENGWLTRDALKDDGFEALKFIITTNKAFNLQREFLPILAEAAKEGQIGNPLLASLVDNIRIGSGLPQIFGTQATIRNDVIYLYPLENEAKVDEWRKMYDLPSLAVQIRQLEANYLLPLLKMQRASGSPNLKQKGNGKDVETAVLGISDSENEVLKFDTKLVNLNVRILTKDLKIPKELNLTKEDFAVVEDETEQEISFFSTVETPFDLVLLLDFSGSTVEKRGLIKKAAQRFVEYACPNDRIAVVVFATEIKIVAELTADKNLLAQKIKEIEVNGGSPIWDSLKFVYQKVIPKDTAGRRSAVVFMTDAEDGSKDATFADVMEMVREGETTIFSVYLDARRYSGQYLERVKRKSQQTLWMLAEESGGQFYKADDVKDLNGIYEQIINDVGKVYSLGYEPKNESRDGGWRNLTVKLKNKPDLITKTRKGYYAK